MNDRMYWYIRAWGKMMQSDGCYIQSQIDLARQENAPESALYKGQDGWRMLEHVTTSERRVLLTNMVLRLIQRRENVG